jgi:NAD kinase
MGSLPPRVIVVTRRSELDELLARHGTVPAATHFLLQRDRDLAEVTARHEALQHALTTVAAAVPSDWRRGHVDRADLPRFLFAPGDIVIAVGQDGLVANASKYLAGQPVIGVDPEPGRHPGVLVRVAPGQVAGLLPAVAAGSAPVEERTMVAARTDDGQELVGLNEVYVGHRSHQSARYLLSAAGHDERQSSSGLVVGTGTGATGWCASIAAGRTPADRWPQPGEAAVRWFVREAWPSPVTGTTLVAGRLDGADQLTLTCESEQLVVFTDGVESDHLSLTWGQRVRIGPAAQHLTLVD